MQAGSDADEKVERNLRKGPGQWSKNNDEEEGNQS